MGEVAMLFAFSTTNSKGSHIMTERLSSSPAWTRYLAVEFDAVREAWGVGADAAVEEFWQARRFSFSCVPKHIFGRKNVTL